MGAASCMTSARGWGWGWAEPRGYPLLMPRSVCRLLGVTGLSRSGPITLDCP